MKIFQSTAREKSKCWYDMKSPETEWISSLAKTPRLPETSVDPSLFSWPLSCLEIGAADVDLCGEEWDVLQGKEVAFFCVLSQKPLEMMAAREGPSFRA